MFTYIRTCFYRKVAWLLGKIRFLYHKGSTKLFQADPTVSCLRALLSNRYLRNEKRICLSLYDSLLNTGRVQNPNSSAAFVHLFLEDTLVPFPFHLFTLLHFFSCLSSSVSIHSHTVAIANCLIERQNPYISLEN